VGRVVEVYQNGTLAGLLTQTDQKHYRFQYDEDYLAHGAPIGFRFPIQKAPFESEGLFPFFDNLASEGWLMHIQSQTQKIDEADTFSMLVHNGADLIGAITLKEVTP
jgi:serine/threonine-protein kinase HipA